WGVRDPWHFPRWSGRRAARGREPVRQPGDLARYPRERLCRSRHAAAAAIRSRRHPAGRSRRHAGRGRVRGYHRDAQRRRRGQSRAAEILCHRGAVTVTNTQSYSQVIRDAMFAYVVQLPFFQGFKARRSKQLPIQEPLLPYLGVYIIDEDMQPDGDPNVGDIRFVHDLRIGFQVIIENNDPVAAELKLDEAFWALMNGLW